MEATAKRSLQKSRRDPNFIPVAEEIYTNYENFVATCPSCGHECIFNRASDLRTFEPIDGCDVPCLNEKCREPFWIDNDSANERHEMLIFDCHGLLKRKQYMNCVLNLALAYETFFSLFLRVELLYKPYASAGPAELDRLNLLAKKLEDKIERCTLPGMCALFLRQITERHAAANFDEAEKIIESLQPKDPENDKIEDLSDTKLVPFLKALKSTTIHKLRNRVVHKQAYRPTREEVENALKETRAILFPLTSRLGLRDDPNLYRSDFRRRRERGEARR